MIPRVRAGVLGGFGKWSIPSDSDIFLMRCTTCQTFSCACVWRIRLGGTSSFLSLEVPSGLEQSSPVFKIFFSIMRHMQQMGHPRLQNMTHCSCHVFCVCVDIKLFGCRHGVSAASVRFVMFPSTHLGLVQTFPYESDRPGYYS